MTSSECCGYATACNYCGCESAENECDHCGTRYCNEECIGHDADSHGLVCNEIHDADYVGVSFSKKEAELIPERGELIDVKRVLEKATLTKIERLAFKYFYTNGILVYGLHAPDLGTVFGAKAKLQSPATGIALKVHMKRFIPDFEVGKEYIAIVMIRKTPREAGTPENVPVIYKMALDHLTTTHTVKKARTPNYEKYVESARKKGGREANRNSEALAASRTGMKTTTNSSSQQTTPQKGLPPPVPSSSNK